MSTRSLSSALSLPLALATSLLLAGPMAADEPRSTDSPPSWTPRTRTTTRSSVGIQIDVGAAVKALSKLFGRNSAAAGGTASVAVVEKNACSEKLWLALADGATCPKVREWETSPLFGASPARSRPGFPAH
ncbi:MAG TPA: hypothetical protein VN851_04475, partial [Thermoanaerobaculia bacterium]|nr:hypothetical protein [Thermoanaerobaculia bacterium]